MFSDLKHDFGEKLYRQLGYQPLPSHSMSDGGLLPVVVMRAVDADRLQHVRAVAPIVNMAQRARSLGTEVYHGDIVKLSHALDCKCLFRLQSIDQDEYYLKCDQRYDTTLTRKNYYRTGACEHANDILKCATVKRDKVVKFIMPDYSQL